jgi:hypothetical protein
MLPVAEEGARALFQVFLLWCREEKRAARVPGPVRPFIGGSTIRNPCVLFGDSGCPCTVPLIRSLGDYSVKTFFAIPIAPMPLGQPA